MHKKQFIALANVIRGTNPGVGAVGSKEAYAYNQWYIMEQAIADFCQSQNPQFNRERWLDYIAGKCGPNGGKVK